VLGVNNKIVQEKLLAIDKLTLQRAISVCRSYEARMSQMKELHGQDQELKVDVVKQKSNQKTQKEATTKKNEIFKCKRCETKHQAKECPAYGKKCRKCGKLNNFQIACKTKQVHNIDQDENEEQEDQLYVGTI
jgi:PHP family Zn ribbon phosphoesterase